MTKTVTTLEWKTLDPATMPKAHADAYAAYKAAYKVASDKRKAFEDKMNADAKLPDGKCLVFSYRYGLGIATGDKVKASAGKKAVSLAQFLQDAITA